MAFQFATDTGRIVQGDPWTPTLVDQQGQPRVVKTGPNAGQPSPQYFFALAVPKTSQAFPGWRAGVAGEAAAAWPSLFPQGPAGPCALPTFSWKILDGDDATPVIDPKSGKVSRNCDKIGWAGHWVIRFTSGFAPKVYVPTGPNAWTETTDRNLLKRGYYVRVGGNTTSNQNAQKPGLYMNVSMIEIVGGGPADEIVSGPDVATVFGNASPATLPAGVAAVSAAGMPPAAPAAPPPTPPAPVGRTMLPAANGATYDQMIAAGWTDATLIANGMMVAPVAAPAALPPTPPAPVAPPYIAYAAPPAAPAAPPPTPPAPVGRTMLPAANGATYDQMIAAGWTDATLIANGMMAA